jgi:hypothetical protein
MEGHVRIFDFERSELGAPSSYGSEKAEAVTYLDVNVNQRDAFHR